MTEIILNYKSFLEKINIKTEILSSSHYDEVINWFHTDLDGHKDLKLVMTVQCLADYLHENQDEIQNVSGLSEDDGDEYYENVDLINLVSYLDSIYINYQALIDNYHPIEVDSYDFSLIKFDIEYPSLSNDEINEIIDVFYLNYYLRSNVNTLIDKILDDIKENVFWIKNEQAPICEIYRGVKLDDEWFEKLNSDEVIDIGVYWSYDDTVPYNFSNDVVFTSKVDLREVNWFETITHRIVYNKSECELRLYEGHPLEITSVDGENKNLTNEIKTKIINHKFVA